MQTREILRIKGGGALYTVTAGATLAEAVGVLVDHDIGSLVVMERGALVGMLTFSQVLRVIKQSGAAGLESSVAAVMEGQPLSVGPDLDMDGLQRLMLARRARYVPVLEGSTLIGVLSFRDVARALLEEREFENQMLKGYIRNWPEE